MNGTGPARSARPAGRIEDDALLRGAGRFGDDVRPAGTAFACFVRTPYAHADVGEIDVSAALATEGVIAVFTGRDLLDAGYHSATSPVPMAGVDCTPMAAPHRPVLAHDRVRHVGEAVALVVAESPAAAQDGADAVMVDYAPLAVVTTAARSAAEGAVQLWPEAPGNLALDWRAPGPGTGAADIEAAFAGATHVVRVRLDNQRLAAVSLEPRVATATWDEASGRYGLRCGTQGVASIRHQTAAAMGIEESALHLTTDDVGGGFGMKGSGYPEYVALLDAARRLKRPVHWAATRGESFLADNQGRDSRWQGALALGAEGRFLALTVEGEANIGAYATGVAAFCSTVHISGCLPAVYDIPRASVRARLYFTNTAPIGPYRGAGRPEANYLLERLIDEAARQTGLDAAELRRRNLITPERMPYATPFGNRYDSGDFPAILEAALARADYAGFAARRRESEARGLRRGIGLGCYLEIAGAMPQETARVSFPETGSVIVAVGASPSGQGHATVFRAVAARRLGLPPEAITVRYGDSDRDPPGFGAVASRSGFMVGGAVARAADAALAKARRTAAILLQCEEDALAFADGRFQVSGSARGVALLELAERARELARDGVIEADLDSEARLAAAPTFPNGCHVAEVEIDPETGAMRVVRYTALDDCGTLIDPVIVEGQIHGGVAQGLGQALSEKVIYDADSGQLVTGSLSDYALPRADDMPPIASRHIEVAATTNPLGAKGTGEAGTTAAPCAVMNALANALPADRALSVDMPATAEKVWRAFNGRIRD